MDRIIRYLTGNKIILNLMIIIIAATGIFSLSKLKKDFMPAVDSDVMTINVVYPGAAAKDVELNAVVPIEDEIKGVSGIEEYSSLCVDGSASVFITFDPDLPDVRKAKDEIFRTVTKENIPDIPDEVEDINIIDMNPNVKPVYELSITMEDGSGTGEDGLYDFAANLQRTLEKIKGVDNVKLIGYREPEIHIDVNPSKMESYNISLYNVINSIRARNVRSTGGTLQSMSKEQNIVTIGEFADPMEVRNVIIRSNFEKKRVRIKDVAGVRKGYRDADTSVMVNNRKSVLLSVSKTENADIVRTARKIDEFIINNRKSFPAGYEVSVTGNKAVAIESLLNVVINNVVIGFIIVVVILFIFSGYKNIFLDSGGNSYKPSDNFLLHAP